MKLHEEERRYEREKWVEDREEQERWKIEPFDKQHETRGR